MHQVFDLHRPSPVRPEPDPVGIPKERVAGLFDGIVAITATLLIVNIRVPLEDAVFTPDDIAAIARPLLLWATSFVMVAVIWTEFHFMFSHSRQWDGGLMILTFAQMALISLIPFAADLVGDFPDSFLATLVFALVMGANGLLLLANIWLLQRKSHLHTAEQSPFLLCRRRRAQMIIYPATIAISLAAASIHDPIAGVLAWALCPFALAIHLRHAKRADRAARRGGSAAT